MKILSQFNSWFAKRIRNVEDDHLIDSVFVYMLLDIFSWSFSFDDDKMMDLLNFLRKENKNRSGASTTQVQNYTEGEFDLVLGAYEARCLLEYVNLVGGDECLLLPYAEETPKRTWCTQLDRLALKELHRKQHKKQIIKKRHLKEYRAHVRKQRVSPNCNVRILNRKKSVQPESTPHGEHGFDHVYEFTSPTIMKTSGYESNFDLMQKTQSVIDSIKMLNYLSDTNSEFSMSNGSRRSSQSRPDDDDDVISEDDRIFSDCNHFAADQTLDNVEEVSFVEEVVGVEELNDTASTLCSTSCTVQDNPIV